MAYKERVPVCGAIIISEYWDKVSFHLHLLSTSRFGSGNGDLPKRLLDSSCFQVLLVKGWTKGSSWSFPRGKINKEEPEAMCAVREVRLDTHFSVSFPFFDLETVFAYLRFSLCLIGRFWKKLVST